MEVATVKWRVCTACGRLGWSHLYLSTGWWATA